MMVGLLVSESVTDAFRNSFYPSQPNGKFRWQEPIRRQRRSTWLKTTTNIVTNTTFVDHPFKYDWKNHWYALTFSNYVPNPSQSAEVTPAAVFGHPLVLWRTSDDGIIHCADDVCPHRSAALSEGRLRDGKLECLYHGWQFNGEKGGACEFIPQLEAKASIPHRACLRMLECREVEGIVWAWMGDTSPDRDPPRQGEELDRYLTDKQICVNDVQCDLPYDHSYLVENLVDPAHILISHDRTEGGGKRENAQAYEMVLDNDSVSSRGFSGRYRFAANKDGPWTELKFEAPGIIRLYSKPRANLIFGAALHCMPLTLGRSRLLFRVYIRGLPWLARFLMRLKPQFLRNLNSCKVLEQDVGLIKTQEDHFKRNPGRLLVDDFLLLGSSDRFVGEYRRWMERVGHGMPWFQGLASRSQLVDNHFTGTELPPALDPAHHRSSGQACVETRYHRHVMHCPETRKGLRDVRRLKRIGAVCTVAALTGTVGLAPKLILTNGASSLLFTRLYTFFLVPAIPLFAMATALLHRLERCFFVSFKRKDQLRTERGA
jgi:phenylpropionate dioxygenase-like ring-hydroxylating dioxygenase large terminal subunit